MLKSIICQSCKLNATDDKLVYNPDSKYHFKENDSINLFTLENVSCRYHIALGVKDTKFVKLFIDKTTVNNRTLTLFKRLLKTTISNPSILVTIEIRRYILESLKIKFQVGYIIKVQRQDKYTNERISKPTYFTFWNTRTSTLFTDLDLVEPMNYCYNDEVDKFPNKITNKEWIEITDNGEISIETDFSTILYNFIRILNITDNYPLVLKHAIVEHFKRELSYAYFLIWEKKLTLKSKIDYNDFDKAFIVILNKILNEYKTNKSFSYALFKSKCLRYKGIIKRYFLSIPTLSFRSVTDISNEIKYNSNPKFQLLRALRDTLVFYINASYFDNYKTVYTKLKKELKKTLKCCKDYKIDINFINRIQNLVDTDVETRFSEWYIDADKLLKDYVIKNITTEVYPDVKQIKI